MMHRRKVKMPQPMPLIPRDSASRYTQKAIAAAMMRPMI